MWNVNLRSAAISIRQTIELIETLWNVNTNKEMRQGINTRINRNIVECKLHSRYVSLHGSIWINRNIVECKFLAYPLRHLPEFRINRNIVECKLKSLLFIYLKPFRINRNIVECKSKYCSDFFCKQIELIETLWNVNN